MATAPGNFKSGTDFMRSDLVESAPQVHIHHLSDERDDKGLGYSSTEFCCHGCGESLLTLHNRRTERGKLGKIKDTFVEKHRHCPDRGYKASCPIYRSKFFFSDVRGKKRTRRKPVSKVMKEAKASASSRPPSTTSGENGGIRTYHRTSSSRRSS